MNLPHARTFPELLDEMTQRLPLHPFITDHGRTLSYSQFKTEFKMVAKGLHALGVRRGDQVAILMGNQIFPAPA